MSYLGRVDVPTNRGRFIFLLSDLQLRTDSVVDENKENILNLIGGWVSLLADSPLSSTKGHKPAKVYAFFLRRLCDSPLEVSVDYGRLSDVLVNELTSNSDGSTSIGGFIDDFRDTPVFKEYLEFRRTSDATLLRYLLSFLCFGKKAYINNPELDAAALRGWLDVEHRLETLQLNSNILDDMAAIVKIVCHDFEMSYLPKHGGGYVSERGVRMSSVKNQLFPYDPMIERLFNSGLSSHRSLHPEAEADYKVSFDGVRMRSRRVSRLKFVPKDWKKTRSICMEPIVFQWGQQCVRLDYERMLDSGLFRRNIRISDQSVNRDSAMFGSWSRLCDTIDLSSASDSVSWKLVSAIFPKKVLKWLHGTRTKIVELPNGEHREVHKFAPMGSALCFPVQSTIYATVCLLSHIIHHCSTRGLPIPQITDSYVSWFMCERFYTNHVHGEEKYQPFRVYGDDIICDSRVTSLAIGILRLLGFDVNSSKSFFAESPFRESCGGYYFDGADVTPFFYKVKRIQKKVTIETLAGIIDTCNRALEYGYLNLRRYLKNFCLYHPIKGLRRQKGEVCNPILFHEEKVHPFSIVSLRPNLNRHLVARHNNDWQRDEVNSVCGAPEKKVVVSERFDNYWYLLWQRSRRYVDGNGDILPSHDRVDTVGYRAVRRWTPN